MAKTVGLKRVIGLPLLVLYGLGNILGAGIYVLIGKVAGEAGYAAPLAFGLAFVVAAFTAFSYMELSSRYPKTAAVPVYLFQAFGKPKLSALVGLLLIGAGIVSAATLAKGFVGYFSVFLSAPDWLITLGVVGALATLAIAGISHSARMAALSTIIEVVGLALVIGAGAISLENAPVITAGIDAGSLLGPGLLLGAFLAFYAFLGFEDMVEVVEEVKNPLKTMPAAILLSLAIATVLYTLVILSALLVRTPDQLAVSTAPLADVFSTATGQSPLILAAIGLAAIINGILVQLVMGSRVLYGLAAQGWISKAFANVHETTRTPAVATLVIAALILFFSLALPLVRLAELTSFLVLLVFTAVNLSLWVIKRRGQVSAGHYKVPLFVPVLGVISALAMLATELYFRFS